MESTIVRLKQEVRTKYSEIADKMQYIEMLKRQLKKKNKDSKEKVEINRRFEEKDNRSRRKERHDEEHQDEENQEEKIGDT